MESERLVSTFLFIDDEPELIEAFARFIERRGHMVKCAEDAQSGLDVLDNEEINAVVLDVFMPEHNGLTVLQYLQSYEDWQNIPVIMMTNVRRGEFNLSPKQLREHGVTEYIEKSTITPGGLLELLEKATQ